jgi:predicted metalloendopeptidase
MVALETMLKENKVDQWKATCVGVYWTEHQANCLPILKMQTLSFTENLNSAVSQRPRDERALKRSMERLWSFRKIIRRENFKAKAKNDQKTSSLLKIELTTWMSAETKVSALAKLNKSRIKLGILTSGKTILPWHQSPEEGGSTNALSMAKILKKILLSWTNQ